MKLSAMTKIQLTTLAVALALSLTCSPASAQWTMEGCNAPTSSPLDTTPEDFILTNSGQNVGFVRVSAYIQDTITFGKLTAGIGIRYDKTKDINYTYNDFTSVIGESFGSIADLQTAYPGPGEDPSATTGYAVYIRDLIGDQAYRNQVYVAPDAGQPDRGQWVTVNSLDNVLDASVIMVTLNNNYRVICSLTTESGQYWFELDPLNLPPEVTPIPVIWPDGRASGIIGDLDMAYYNGSIHYMGVGTGNSLYHVVQDYETGRVTAAEVPWEGNETYDWACPNAEFGPEGIMHWAAVNLSANEVHYWNLEPGGEVWNHAQVAMWDQYPLGRKLAMAVDPITGAVYLAYGKGDGQVKIAFRLPNGGWEYHTPGQGWGDPSTIAVAAYNNQLGTLWESYLPSMRSYIGCKLDF